jgi:hypothetical protein
MNYRPPLNTKAHWGEPRRATDGDWRLTNNGTNGYWLSVGEDPNGMFHASLWRFGVNNKRFEKSKGKFKTEEAAIKWVETEAGLYNTALTKEEMIKQINKLPDGAKIYINQGMLLLPAKIKAFKDGEDTICCFCEDMELQFLEKQFPLTKKHDVKLPIKTRKKLL